MSKEKIKKDNRKALKKWIPMMIVSGAIGAVTGLVSSLKMTQGFGEAAKEWIAESVRIAAPYGVILCNAAVMIIGIVYYQKAKSMYSACSSEDEADEKSEEIGSLLDKGMIMLNMGIIFSYGIFSCWICGLLQGNHVAENKYFEGILVLLTIVSFVGGVFGSVKLSQVYVDLMRVMNPRLSGSVYDSKFHDKWEESCDEWEKLMIYKAGYRAFIKGNKACAAVWSVMLILGMFFGIGSLPAVSVTVVWGVMVFVYYREAYRLEHKSGSIVAGGSHIEG